VSNEGRAALPGGIDDRVMELVWPNGADFDPATLHDWPDYVQAFVSRARSWMTAAHRTA